MLGDNHPAAPCHPHGQGMVLMAALATVEFIEEELPVLAEQAKVVAVPADGLCFWASLYLACCSSKELYVSRRIISLICPRTSSHWWRFGLLLAVLNLVCKEEFTNQEANESCLRKPG